MLHIHIIYSFIHTDLHVSWKRLQKGAVPPQSTRATITLTTHTVISAWCTPFSSPQSFVQPTIFVLQRWPLVSSLPSGKIMIVSRSPVFGFLLCSLIEKRAIKLHAARRRSNFIQNARYLISEVKKDREEMVAFSRVYDKAYSKASVHWSVGRYL